MTPHISKRKLSGSSFSLVSSSLGRLSGKSLSISCATFDGESVVLGWRYVLRMWKILWFTTHGGRISHDDGTETSSFLEIGDLSDFLSFFRLLALAQVPHKMSGNTRFHWWLQALDDTGNTATPIHRLRVTWIFSQNAILWYSLCPPCGPYTHKKRTTT